METIAFARGVPSPDALPVDALREAADRALRADGRRILSYGTGGGYPPLRELIAAWHGVSPAQVAVTTGSLQGFVFLVQLLLDDAAAGVAPGVVVENPTYDRPLLLLRRLGANVHQVNMTGTGIDIDELEATFERERPTLLYVIPNFQNPSGATLDEAGRVRILELAVRHGVTVLEDDPYGELHFETPVPASMFSRRGDTDVIYTSSFSKTISPGLRVGYMVLPTRLAARFEKLANDTYISPSLLGQATVCEFIDAGLLPANIDRCRGMLQERCDAMCTALDEHLPDATYLRPGGGYFLWAGLAGGVDAEALLPIASQHGVSFVPGSAFGRNQGNALRLAFSYPSVDEVGEGVRRLAEALRSTLANA